MIDLSNGKQTERENENKYLRQQQPTKIPEPIDYNNNIIIRLTRTYICIQRLKEQHELQVCYKQVNATLAYKSTSAI